MVQVHSSQEACCLCLRVLPFVTAVLDVGISVVPEPAERVGSLLELKCELS